MRVTKHPAAEVYTRSRVRERARVCFRFAATAGNPIALPESNPIRRHRDCGETLAYTALPVACPLPLPCPVLCALRTIQPQNTVL